MLMTLALAACCLAGDCLPSDAHDAGSSVLLASKVSLLMPRVKRSRCACGKVCLLPLVLVLAAPLGQGSPADSHDSLLCLCQNFPW